MRQLLLDFGCDGHECEVCIQPGGHYEPLEHTPDYCAWADCEEHG